MKKNTVLLNVNDYNELRDFKKEIEEGKIYVIRDVWQNFGGGSMSKKFFTDSEIIADLCKKHESLTNRIKDLKIQIEKKDVECKKDHEPKEITLDDIKKMSWWEFRKWKRS